MKVPSEELSVRGKSKAEAIAKVFNLRQARRSLACQLTKKKMS
jgi:hypothetical protein